MTNFEEVDLAVGKKTAHITTEVSIEDLEVDCGDQDAMTVTDNPECIHPAMKKSEVRVQFVQKANGKEIICHFDLDVPVATLPSSGMTDEPMKVGVVIEKPVIEAEQEPEVSAPEPVAEPPKPMGREEEEEESPWKAAIDELAAEFAPRTELEVLHTRIPRWLAEGLEDKFLEFRRKNRKVTKQTVVTYALIQALGITPPDDFRLL